ncbi:hypothetical protein DES38_1138 [Streptohalobacillus salinus]|uniref:Uncharacterized protein n=1 Tax=Streptohalobacillus salinus TaxID=621096 RepID=A0A2V3W1W4_9BACI|nr:hypothetical protein [Streptohalobacillus salinus]PXW88277.1 hypothetical protein DES38_1138 [Streptohalobacillus salinus]
MFDWIELLSLLEVVLIIALLMGLWLIIELIHLRLVQRQALHLAERNHFDQQLTHALESFAAINQANQKRYSLRQYLADEEKVWNSELVLTNNAGECYLVIEKESTTYHVSEDALISFLLLLSQYQRLIKRNIVSRESILYLARFTLPFIQPDYYYLLEKHYGETLIGTVFDLNVRIMKRLLKFKYQPAYPLMDQLIHDYRRKRKDPRYQQLIQIEKRLQNRR